MFPVEDMRCGAASAEHGRCAVFRAGRAAAARPQGVRYLQRAGGADSMCGITNSAYAAVDQPQNGIAKSLRLANFPVA
jgi:hypothetical protein